MQQFYALPYDRWEGYAAERGQLLAHPRGVGTSSCSPPTRTRT